MKNAIVGHYSDIDQYLPLKEKISDAKLVSVDAPLKPRLNLFSYPETKISVSYIKETGMFIYLWGTFSHQLVKKASIPEWISQVVTQGKFSRFRELIGCFVIIIEQNSDKRLLFVTDILGVRPMFVRLDDHQINFGSNAWTMFEQGLTSSEVDYESVACWLAYGHNCNGGAIFRGLKRLGAGRVYQIDHDGFVETPYCVFEKGDKLSNASKAADEINDIMVSTIRTVLSETDECSLALSGGWDSRYLLALAAKETNCNLRLVHIASSPSERKAAIETAKCLGIDLKIIEVSGNEIDLYDDYFGQTVDGFPISLHSSYMVAKSFPGLSSINGFLGDSLIRGSHDKYQNLLETEYENDLLEILQKQTLLRSGKTKSFMKQSYWRSILSASRAPIQKIDNEGIHFKKRFSWRDLYVRQVNYIANNFLQHLEISEPILPFMNYDLLNYKLQHAYNTFSNEIYKTLFERHFPFLAKIPTAAELMKVQSYSTPFSKYTKIAARSILPHLITGKRLELLSRLRSTLICVSALIGVKFKVRAIENLTLDMYRIYLLEEKLRKSKVEFNWKGIEELMI